MSDSDLFESDTEDVKPETPEQKTSKKLADQFDVGMETTENYLDHLPDTFREKSDKPSENLNKHLEQQRPFVFYSIQDILNFSTDYFPVNNKFRTIGILKRRNLNTLYLSDYQKCSSLKILISFQLVEQVPSVNSLVEVFGSIELQKVGPVFLVNLWKYRSGNVLEYVDCLKRLKQFVHPEHKSITKDDLSNCTYLETSVNIDSNLDINESALNRAVEEAEKFYKDFQRTLVIDNN